jgi:HlyD family secretion protein
MTTITTAGKSGALQNQTTARWRSWPVLTGAAAVVLLLGVYFFGGSAGGEGLSADGPIYVAERGPLTIHVTESGNIQAREQVVLKCEVEGQTTIIWIVEEGKHVKKGDLLVELDASERQDELLEQQIRVKNAEAAYIRSREALEITRSQGESDISKAQLAYEFAKQDLKKYVEGEYPKELDEMNARIKLAEADLEDAQNTAQWSKKLYEEKYIAETDLTRDELSRDRAELDLKTAIANRDLLVNYTYGRRVRELESDVEQTEMSLERVKRQANANLVQDEADLTARELELQRQKERLAKDEDMLSKTKIYAPTEGMVVYATTGQGDRRGNDEPLEAGRGVREREELIYLPTANAMRVNIKVHESSLKKVQAGQRVRVTINALPGREYWGKVSRIAPLPDAQSFWRGNPDLKVFNTEINLDGELEGVRTGMTCKAQIIIQQLEDIISVPVQSVVKLAGQPKVFVKRGGRVEPVDVELGLDNKDRIHIKSGLSEGDQVLTNPPLEGTGNVAPGSDRVPTDTEETGTTDEDAGETPAASDETQAESGPTPEAQGQPSPEQREQMRQRFQNMTPEEREAMRARMQERGGQRGGAPGGGGGQQNQ